MQENNALTAAREIAQAQSSQGSTNTDALEQQVCAEAGIWETAAARRALNQAGGDPAHAVSMLRVWAATQPHIASVTVHPGDTSVVRRLSSAYPAVPGGQWLGLAPDLIPRRLDWTDEPAADTTTRAPRPTVTDDDAPTRSATPRVRDLISGAHLAAGPEEEPGRDPADTVLVPPLRRADRLALLARGETGAMVALAALSLGRRQEAVLVELTVSVAAIRIPHPRNGIPCAVAEVPITEVEVVIDADIDGTPGLAMGFGASLGTVERRAIAMALLDGAMQADGNLQEPLLLDDQTVVGATDGPATNGFVEHLRLPHYASFTAYLSAVAPKEAT
jgi:alpha-D-ribose 1-methylphosphonate 5-triphosphate synthase subunit PhnI